jgi:predicted nucleic acid-binding protein
LNYLIDTNVISELRKKNCNPLVKAYIDFHPPESLFLSAVTIGEIVKGIEKTQDAVKRDMLILWLEKIRRWFAGNTLSLTPEIMAEWGRLIARHPRTLPFMDSLLAATCLAHRLTLITRNEADFADIPGLSIVNPWARA